MGEVLTLSNSEDLLKLSGTGRYEMIEGMIRKMSPSGEKHGAIAFKTGYLIGKHVYENKLGITTAAETGYRLSSNPDTVRAPDVAFKSNEKVSPDGITEGYSTIMPDLVVEVNSPGDTHGKVVKKVNMWLEAGVREVWVVEPQDNSVIVYDSSGKPRVYSQDDMLKSEKILHGFKCKVSEIFSIL